MDGAVEQFGEQVTEEVGQIAFTADGEGIAPGQFQDFGLSLGVPDKAGSTLTFKAVQTYSSGEVVRWIGPPDSESPAPQVKLTAGEGETAEPAAQQPQAPAAEQDDDSGSDTLSIIALMRAMSGLSPSMWRRM